MIKTKKELLRALVCSVLLVALDQITKFFAVWGLKDKPDFVIIDNVFVLHYLENNSAAFSLDPISILHRIFHFRLFDTNPAIFMLAKMSFLLILTLIVIVLLAILFIRIPNTKHFRYMNWIIVAFISGAIGNCIDRFVNQYVVDFFYFKLIDFPIFNVADIYVTCAAFAIILLGLFYYKDEDYELIFPSKKKKG